MEEDIKILEKYLKVGIFLNNRGCQALENLIKGYRELEKDLHEMTISNNHKKENWIHKNCLNDYIPKTKIKEKIEEYEQMRKATYTDLTHFGDLRRDTVLEVLQVLQELMEDK